MLVLSRQRDESIIIADNIKITIVDIRGDKVRLGIDAPKDIATLRRNARNTSRLRNGANRQLSSNRRTCGIRKAG